MNIWRGQALRRAVLWLWLGLMLAPTLVGCAAPGAGPSGVRLAAVVIGGDRLARAEEAGAVSVRRGGAPVAVRVGMALQPGDRVETGPDAEAVIRYPSGTELFLRQNSGGRIGSFTEVFGEVFAKIKGLFSVETTFVTAGARGTAYLVRAEPGGATTVIVFDGRVEVGSTTGAWRSVELGRGTMVQAHPRAPVPMAAPPEELARTREWVERLERLVPASGGGGAAAAIGIAVLMAALLASSSSDADRPSSDGRRAPTHAPDLAPPRRLSPGSEDPKVAPSLDCRSALTLRWAPVAGARHYVVEVDLLPVGARRWQDLPRSDTTATWTRLSPGLEGLVRWSVRAVGELGAGPVSPVMTLRCSSAIVR